MQQVQPRHLPAWDTPASSVGDKAAARWVEPFAIAVFALTLVYAVFGTPGDAPTDAMQTDHVNPLNSLLWLGLLAMAMPVLYQRWRDVVALALSNWALLLLFAYFAISITWALDPAVAMRRFLFSVVQLVLFAILLSGIRRAPLLHVTIVTVCCAAAVADLIYWAVAPGYAMQDDGFGGLQGQKNQAGLLMMYGILAAVPCLFMLRGWLWRAAIVVCTLIMAILLIATRSTTSQSVILSAAVVMPVLLQIWKLPRRVILAIAASSVLFLLVVAFSYLVWCGMTGMDPMLPLRDATFSERTGIWSFVVDEIQKRPLFGAGYSSFWAIDPAVQPSLKSDQWFGVYAIINEGHQGYLDQLATGGIVGLAGALFVLFRSIVVAGQAVGGTQPAAQAWRTGSLARPTVVFYLALLLGLIVHNFTESNLFNNNALLAVALLIAVLDLEKWRIARRQMGRLVEPIGIEPTTS